MTQPTLKQLFGEQIQRQTTASAFRKSSQPSTRHDAGKQSTKKRKPSPGSDADAESDEEQESSKKRTKKKADDGGEKPVVLRELAPGTFELVSSGDEGPPKTVKTSTKAEFATII